MCQKNKRKSVLPLKDVLEEPKASHCFAISQSRWIFRFCQWRALRHTQHPAIFQKKIYELNCFTTQKNRVKWHDTVFKNHVKKSYYNICERTDNLNFGGFFVCFDFPKFDPSTAGFYQNSPRFVNKINFWRENRENITFLS